ncbi:Uncharacterised protein [uncultured archaeon]|nr:Uncharacterised protein [uncultured archaeon]
MPTPVIKIFKPYVTAKGKLAFRPPTNKKAMDDKSVAQREKFGKAVQTCKGKAGNRAEFSQCMRENL